MTSPYLAVTVDPVALIVGLAALLAAVGYLIRVGVKVSRFCRTILALVDRELTHNTGSSIKDDVYGVALAVGKLQRDFEGLSRDFYRHLAHQQERTS